MLDKSGRDGPKSPQGMSCAAVVDIFVAPPAARATVRAMLAWGNSICGAARNLAERNMDDS